MAAPPVVGRAANDRRVRRRARIGGAAAGFAALAICLPLMRTAPAQTTPVTEVRIALAPPAELAIAPAGATLAGALRAGAQGIATTVVVRNQTGAILALRARANRADPAVDAALRLDLRGERTVLASGPPAALTGAGAAPLWLAPGGSVPLRLRARLDGVGAAAAGGRQMEIDIELIAEAVG